MEKKFRMVHNNFNVYDLSKSLQFYEDAFDMKMVKKIAADDYSYIIVYLSDGNSDHLLELTWIKGMERPYDLGDNEFHLAFEVNDFAAAKVRHRKMGCICHENEEMGIYFVNDPDGYWIEVMPAKKEN